MCLTVGTAEAPSSLTCVCEGEERANEGRQQQQQLDLHRGERWKTFLLLFRLLGRRRGCVCGCGGTPSGQRARHQRPRTRRAHTEQPLRTVKVKDPPKKQRGQEGKEKSLQVKFGTNSKKRKKKEKEKKVCRPEVLLHLRKVKTRAGAGAGTGRSHSWRREQKSGGGIKRG